MGGRRGADVLKERAHATQVLEASDLQVIDPAEGENILPERVVDTKLDYLRMKAFVSKDEFAIRQSHCILVLTGDTPSEGTGIEFGLGLAIGIPVIVISPKRVSGELMGFWNIKADAIFATVEEAAEFIATNYDGGY